MKFMLSAVFAVMMTSQVVMAETVSNHGAGAPKPVAKPTYQAPKQTPQQVFDQIVGSCNLQQGANAVPSVTRTIGADRR